MIVASHDGLQAFEDIEAAKKREMLVLARKLPVAAWVQEEAQNGFGLPSLATLIGETGDLANYAGPAKLWRRMGCAPWTWEKHKGQWKTRMGSTWRKYSQLESLPKEERAKLPKDEWHAYGYSPRRRSVSFLIGDNLMKGNFLGLDRGLETEEIDEDPEAWDAGDATDADDTAIVRIPGPYRARYDEAKLLAAQNHPDWSKDHCHKHGILLAAKLLLKNLWVAWRQG
jgi:hypothetical protein